LAGTISASALPPRPVYRAIRCASCLRQIGTAILNYASQHAGQSPTSLQSLKLPFPHGPTDFTCPTTGQTRNVILPGFHTPLRDDAVLLLEPRPADGGANVLFGNGTVKFIRAGDALAP
jgi:hypothetical protein